MDKVFPINLSVVIPSHKETRLDELRARIESALHMDARVKKFEVTIVRDPTAKGYGFSLKRGIATSKYDWILIMDADFSYSPSDIHKLITDVPYSDMVVAERRGTIGASGLIRTIGRRIVKKYAIFRTGFPIIDINSGFRIFSRELYNACSKILPDKFSFTSTITLFAFFNSFRVNYVPVFYMSRVGSSTLKPTEFFTFIRTINRCVRNFRNIKRKNT